MDDSRLIELCFQSSNLASYFITKTNVWTRVQQRLAVRRIIPSKFMFSSIIHGALRLKYEKVVWCARTRNQQTEQNVLLRPWCLEFRLRSAASLFSLGHFFFPFQWKQLFKVLHEICFQLFIFHPVRREPNVLIFRLSTNRPFYSVRCSANHTAAVTTRRRRPAEVQIKHQI